MGRIKDETVREFQKAVKLEYGQELDFDDAYEILHDLATYFWLLGKMDAKQKALEGKPPPEVQ